MSKPKVIVTMAQFTRLVNAEEKLKALSSEYNSCYEGWMSVMELCLSLGMVQTDDLDNGERVLRFIRRYVEQVKKLEDERREDVDASNKDFQKLQESKSRIRKLEEENHNLTSQCSQMEKQVAALRNQVAPL